MQLRIDITEAELKALEHEAVMNGFKREEPRKAWTDKERKEAARWYLGRVIGLIAHRRDS
jgi:hypothetical protein